MRQTEFISSQEINKFTALVKLRDCKLPASRFTRLTPHLYKDYLQKIKQFAGKTTPPDAPSPDLGSKSFRGLSKAHSSREIGSGRLNPSYYYSDGLEILSLKEFVVLLEEAKLKQQREERAKSRQQEREFVRYVGRNIQSSHSRRDLRLTSSSAHRISERMRQLQLQNIYER